MPISDDHHTIIPGSYRTEIGNQGFNSQRRSRAKLGNLQPATSHNVSAVRLPEIQLSPEKSESALITENEKGGPQTT